MHEMGNARAVFASIQQIAREKKITKVTRVKLKLAPLAVVDEEELRQCLTFVLDEAGWNSVDIVIHKDVLDSDNPEAFKAAIGDSQAITIESLEGTGG